MAYDETPTEGNSMIPPLVAPIRFVRRNRTRILVVTTITLAGVVAIQQRGIKQHNEFLKENGLFEKFYELSETV
jgi:hypothetical protein